MDSNALSTALKCWFGALQSLEKVRRQSRDLRHMSALRNLLVLIGGPSKAPRLKAEASLPAKAPVDTAVAARDAGDVAAELLFQRW